MTTFGVALIAAWWVVLIVAWRIFHRPPAGEAGGPAPGRRPPADERRP